MHSDGQFVGVVHTAGKWVGNDDKMGHVDWYANEGRAPQPGCKGESIDLLCSHFRESRANCCIYPTMLSKFLKSCAYQAWKIFAHAIVRPDNLGGFVGIQCRNYKDFKAGKCCTQVNKLLKNYKNMLALTKTLILN